MAVDTPATIAIIGAGPIGLEAALYARFLGYDVRIYERDAVARSLRDDEPAAQHVWRASTSPLGIAALSAQQAQWQPAEPDALLSATELAERYFLPLAQSDLLVDHLLIGSEVIGLERDLQPGQIVEEDEVTGFRLRVRSPQGEQIESADVVIDASGAGTAADAERLLFGRLHDPVESSGQRDEQSPGRLVTAEPDYYILGAKSAGSSNHLSYVDGLVQIRDLFTIIADRVTLDLYARIAATS